MNENKYGGLIEKLRAIHNVSQDVLANILLLDSDTMADVEQGKTLLSDSQLNICSNIFDVSKFALENGEIRPRIKHAELQFNIDRLLEQYKETVESQSFMLEAIQEVTPYERYKAQHSDIKDSYINGYFVFDELKNDVVRDKDNFPVKYDTAKEALEAARQMDELYKKGIQDKNISDSDIENKDENVTDSVTQTIDNLEYDDEGYLHFTVEADGYELEGLFRINDPENGQNMEIVSIDYGDLHPEIKKQWGQIEDYLKNEVMQHMEKQNIEKNISETQEEAVVRL